MYGTVRSGCKKVEEQYDVVVCGGGLAGFCAAVAAARNGAKACLVQDRPVFGGNSSSEIRVPPQGAASSHAYARETGIIHELLVEERARNHEDPRFDNGWINSVWDMVLYDMAVKTPNLSFHLNTPVTGVIMADDRTVEAVVCVVNHAEIELTLRADTFIDCTGDGTVAAFAGCEWRMGTEGRDEFGEPHAPEHGSGDVMGNSLHFKAKDMGRPVPFVAPDWAVSYDDPDFFYKQGRWPGSIQSGFWWMELSIPWHTIYDNETLRHELTRHVLGVWDYIKNKDPELKIAAANYALDWVGQVPGKRESRRLMGEYFMTEHDPLQKTVFSDEVAYGGWFIDLHEAGGLLASFSEKSLEDKEYAARSYVGPYGIPLRIMIAKGMNNLMMSGRNVSVTHAALGTVRVQGTTAMMGQAAGTAAAVAARRGIPVKDIPEKAVQEVQQLLLRDDCFLPNAVNEDSSDLARTAAVRASSEALLSGAVRQGEPEIHMFESLTERRGQWIAVGAERIEAIELYVTNDTDQNQPLELELHAVDHIWDYRVQPGEPLRKASLQISPGASRWVRWLVDLDTSELRGTYVRVDALENPSVRWHVAEELVPGHVSAYDMRTGQMRRFGRGVTLLFRVSPAQACYSAKQAVSGVSRPYRYTNLWRSDPNEPMPQWLELSWEQPVEIGHIRLSFAGQILRDYRSYRELYRDPQCVKDANIEAFLNGQWVLLHEIRGNYRRRVTVTLDNAVRTERLRITVLSTNGDPSAAVYEVRCYSER